jgi:hypothetical protein
LAKPTQYYLIPKSVEFSINTARKVCKRAAVKKTSVASEAQGSRPETQMTYLRLSSGVETLSQISSLMTTFSAEASAVRGKNKDSQKRLNKRVASVSGVVSEVVSSKMMMTISLDEASEEAACSNK